MGTRMPHDPQRLGIFFGKHAQRHFAVARQRRDGIDRLAIDLGGNGGLCQAGADIGGDINRPNAVAIFANAAVGEFNFEHGNFLGEDRETCRRDNLQIYG